MTNTELYKQVNHALKKRGNKWIVEKESLVKVNKSSVK